MIYSVWDANSKAYNYYQTADKPTDVDPPTPSHLKYRFTSPLGHGSDVAWPLPSDAQPIGSGAMPRGMIATTDAPFSYKWPLIIGGVLVTWWALR